MHAWRRVLRLHDCAGLRNAELASASLEQLSLCACPGLARLTLSCPALQDLQARPQAAPASAPVHHEEGGIACPWRHCL